MGAVYSNLSMIEDRATGLINKNNHSYVNNPGLKALNTVEDLIEILGSLDKTTLEKRTERKKKRKRQVKLI